MLDKNLDRRQYARGRGDVEYLFAVQVEDIVTETKNISEGGMLCKVNRHFELKSIVSTTFILPCYSGKRVTFDKVHCKAHVVRCEPCPEIDDPECHSMGLQFVRLSKDQKAKIGRYVKNSFASIREGKKSKAVSVKIASHK